MPCYGMARYKFSPGELAHMVVARTNSNVGKVKKGQRIVVVKRYWHPGYWVEQSTRATPRRASYPRPRRR